MAWYYWILAAAGVNWLAPLLMWLYPLFLIVFSRDFTFKGFYGPFAKFALATQDVEPWHAKLWKDWGGIGCYGFMCFKDAEGTWDDAWLARTLVHEGTHCWQWAFLGLMQPILYILFSAFIWAFLKNKHAYLDNPFERQARRRAGQQVDIPKEKWSWGPNDRWPWW